MTINQLTERAAGHKGRQGDLAGPGILRLARQYSTEGLETARDRGLDIGAPSYSSIQSGLKDGLGGTERPSLIWHKTSLIRRFNTLIRVN